MKTKLSLFCMMLLLCMSCAATEVIPDIVITALSASDHVIKDAGKFLDNPAHQEVIAEIGIEVVTGYKISALDVVGHCAVSGCHSIKM